MKRYRRAIVTTATVASLFAGGALGNALLSAGAAGAAGATGTTGATGGPGAPGPGHHRGPCKHHPGQGPAGAPAPPQSQSQAPVQSTQQ